MRTPIKIALLLLAVPILFIGCKKSELADNPPATNDNALKSITFCGSTTTAYLYGYFDKVKTSYGTVTVGNDANNLYVTFSLDGNWTFMPKDNDPDIYYNGCYLFVGTKEEIEAAPYNYNINISDSTGHFNFPMFKNHYTPLIGGEKTYTFTISRATITADCPMVVAFAGITDGTVKKYVSARNLLKGYGYWFTHCMQSCTVGKCETAYAFGGDQNDCFLNLGIGISNWGWSNGPISSPASLSWPIYAGAGQCDITKGIKVGTLTVSYAGTTATITYTLDSPYKLTATHLWVGNGTTAYLPYKNGKYSSAPGQFVNIHTLNSVSTDSYTITGLTGPIRIAAHAEVCW